MDQPAASSSSNVPSPKPGEPSKDGSSSSSLWTTYDFPPMSENIDAYLKEVIDTVEEADRRAKSNIRSTDYTVTNFKATKQDRLWEMKEKGELIDSVLVTADGLREVRLELFFIKPYINIWLCSFQYVHIDMLFLMEKEMTPFFTQVPSTSADSSSVPSTSSSTSSKPFQLWEYRIDPSIAGSSLKHLVYFAYHRRCINSLAGEEALKLATIGLNFKINSLVIHVFEYLVENCTVDNVLMIYKLGATYVTEKDTLEKQMAIVQNFIEDHFQQVKYFFIASSFFLNLTFFLTTKKVWTVSHAEVLSLDAVTLSKILSWEKLDIKNEHYAWVIIEQWISNDIGARLQYLPELIKKCLRFGRLPEATRNVILGGSLVTALPKSEQSSLNTFVSGVLSNEQLKQTIRDGFNLPYSKAVFYFRPRETKQYLLCAGGWIEGQTTDSMELFDYQRNLWLSTPLKLPSRISYFGLELLDDNCLYLFGGSDGREIFKALSVLDLSGAKMPVWRGKCSMIERRCYVTSALLNGILYALGGFNTTRRMRRCERYDRRLDSWEEIAELNLARSDAAATVHGGKLYVAGGINDAAIEATVEVYYPETNTWRLVKQMSSPRTSFALVACGNRLFAIAGNDGARRVSTVESYDPQSDNWQEEASLGGAQHNTASRARGRSTFRAVNFNGEIYVVGGYNSESSLIDHF